MNHSKTKIIATLGPATSTEEKIEEIILAGIDMCRLNFSHGSHDEHLTMIKIIRKVSEKIGVSTAILADLQGPKIRLGEIKNGSFDVVDGEELILTTEKCEGDKNGVYLSYTAFPKDTRIGDSILIDDGKIKLEVVKTDANSKVYTKVIHGGTIKPRKGVNLPDTKISIPSLTEKDIEDVKFILENDLDWIALSFVRWSSDIVELKNYIRKSKSCTKVIAKIEKPEAIAEIDAIIAETDAIMVARGDLGVEVPFDKVPHYQKLIVRKSIQQGKPVIIATQMLESMIENFRPTRAEANDIANSVYDGADCLMLSGETSVGKYPTESIVSMESIINNTEEKVFSINQEHLPNPQSPTYIPDSVCYNACKMADQSGAKAIICFTKKGYSAFRVASNRPKARIYVFTPDRTLIRQLNMVWGCRAFYIEKGRDMDDAMSFALRTLKKLEVVTTCDLIVYTGSLPFFEKDTPDFIGIKYV